jgi:PKHD-type hydroxylase
LEKIIMKKEKDASYDWWLEVGVTESWAYQHELFNNEEIKEIHELVKSFDTKKGEVGGDKEHILDTEVRDSDITFFKSGLPETNWVFERITGSILEINRKFWQFDLARIETLQHSVYNVGQFYADHVDMMYQAASRATRKLSFSIQLDDPKDYEGGDLLIKTSKEPQAAKREKGTIIFFPSYVLHEVTPVTKGTRRALVGWVSGPPFK